MTNAPKPVYVVFADKLNRELGDFDQVCMSEAEAKREVKDLKKMGHDEAHALRATSEEAVEAWQDARRDGKRKAFPRA